MDFINHPQYSQKWYCSPNSFSILFNRFHFSHPPLTNVLIPKTEPLGQSRQRQQSSSHCRVPIECHFTPCGITIERIHHLIPAHGHRPSAPSRLIAHIVRQLDAQQSQHVQPKPTANRSARVPSILIFSDERRRVRGRLAGQHWRLQWSAVCRPERRVHR